MERAIENLVRNALEATKSGGEITVGWRELGESERESIFPGFVGPVVGIYGEDTGGGLPKDLTQSAILRPFVTTKRSNIGLGLSIAQEIVELHGGILFLGGSPQGGMTFEVLIPAINAVCDTRSPATGPCKAVSSGQHGAPCGTKSADAPDLCWVLRGRDHRKQTGKWPETCVNCPVFKSHNLQSYFDRRDVSGKDE